MTVAPTIVRTMTTIEERSSSSRHRERSSSKQNLHSAPSGGAVKDEETIQEALFEVLSKRGIQSIGGPLETNT